MPCSGRVSTGTPVVIYYVLLIFARIINSPVLYNTSAKCARPLKAFAKVIALVRDRGALVPFENRRIPVLKLMDKITYAEALKRPLRCGFGNKTTMPVLAPLEHVSSVRLTESIKRTIMAYWLPSRIDVILKVPFKFQEPRGFWSTIRR